jgi:hypothetical protein
MADVLQLYAITGVRGEIDNGGKFTHAMRKIVHERVHRIKPRKDFDRIMCAEISVLPASLTAGVLQLMEGEEYLIVGLNGRARSHGASHQQMGTVHQHRLEADFFDAFSNVWQNSGTR